MKNKLLAAFGLMFITVMLGDLHDVKAEALSDFSVANSFDVCPNKEEGLSRNFFQGSPVVLFGVNTYVPTELFSAGGVLDPRSIQADRPSPHISARNVSMTIFSSDSGGRRQIRVVTPDAVTFSLESTQNIPCGFDGERPTFGYRIEGKTSVTNMPVPTAQWSYVMLRIEPTDVESRGMETVRVELISPSDPIPPTDDGVDTGEAAPIGRSAPSAPSDGSVDDSTGGTVAAPEAVTETTETAALSLPAKAQDFAHAEGSGCNLSQQPVKMGDSVNGIALIAMALMAIAGLAGIRVLGTCSRFLIIGLTLIGLNSGCAYYKGEQLKGSKAGPIDEAVSQPEPDQIDIINQVRALEEQNRLLEERLAGPSATQEIRDQLASIKAEAEAQLAEAEARLRALIAAATPTPPDGADCGNGTREGMELCDDGNLTNGDGCSSTCSLEYAMLPGSIDVNLCGDGNKSASEECDDHNTRSGDGCSWPDCKIELACGNGRLDSGEQCDGEVDCDASCRTIVRSCLKTSECGATEYCHQGVCKSCTDPVSSDPDHVGTTFCEEGYCVTGFAFGPRDSLAVGTCPTTTFSVAMAKHDMLLSDLLEMTYDPNSFNVIGAAGVPDEAQMQKDVQQALTDIPQDEAVHPTLRAKVRQYAIDFTRHFLQEAHDNNTNALSQYKDELAGVIGAFKGAAGSSDAAVQEIAAQLGTRDDSLKAEIVGLPVSTLRAIGNYYEVQFAEVVKDVRKASYNPWMVVMRSSIMANGVGSEILSGRAWGLIISQSANFSGRFNHLQGGSGLTPYWYIDGAQWQRAESYIWTALNQVRRSEGKGDYQAYQPYQS